MKPSGEHLFCFRERGLSSSDEDLATVHDVVAFCQAIQTFSLAAHLDALQGVCNRTWKSTTSQSCYARTAITSTKPSTSEWACRSLSISIGCAWTTPLSWWRTPRNVHQRGRFPFRIFLSCLFLPQLQNLPELSAADLQESEHTARQTQRPYENSSWRISKDFSSGKPGTCRR